MASLPQTKAGQSFAMLRGIRVLDLTTSIAGPYACQLLSDFGANVIKVERPRAGDDARAWGPPFLDGESLWFLSVNRNKQSIALDYSGPAGRAVLDDLVRISDVVVINHTPRTAAKLGCDAARLRALHPGLIHVTITGFGSEGSRSELPCYDLIAEGYAGIMDVTGEPDGDAQKVGAPAADMLAGQDAAMAAMAALFERTKTRSGRTIDVSLVESMARFSTCRIVTFLGSGELPRRSGGKDSVIAIYQAFETADLPMTLGLGNDAIWSRFWAALGAPGVATLRPYSSNALRRENRAEIVAVIAEALVKQPRAHWLRAFAEARVPAGPINRLDELTSDAEFARRGLFYRLDEGGRSVPQVGMGIHVDGRPGIPRNAPPRLGEHSAMILRDLLDYRPEQIEALAESNVLGLPSKPGKR